MPLTITQTNTFFTNNAYMALPAATIPPLNNEGITTVGDLLEFDETIIKQIVENLKKPNDRIPNPDPNAPPGSTIPRPPYVFGAKSQARLVVACNLIKYYDTVGRELTLAGLIWQPVMKNLADQWKALKQRMEDEIDTPRVTKTLPVLKWMEAFTDFLHRKIGIGTIPLAYVIRENVVPTATAPPLQTQRPHGAIYGSIEAELIARASHDHALFRDDNAAVYFLLLSSYLDSSSHVTRRATRC